MFIHFVHGVNFSTMMSIWNIVKLLGYDAPTTESMKGLYLTTSDDYCDKEI